MIVDVVFSKVPVVLVVPIAPEYVSVSGLYTLKFPRRFISVQVSLQTLKCRPVTKVSTLEH